MSSQLNKASYEKLIEEDLEVLKLLPDSLERSHIEHVLWWSINTLYPEPVATPASPARACNRLECQLTGFHSEACNHSAVGGPQGAKAGE